MQFGTIDIPEWQPDLAAPGGENAGVISGVVPRGDGFGPFKSLVEFTAALPANRRGYFFARRSDGSIAIFAGTAKRLYRLDNTTFKWIDVSKGAVDYPTLVANANWRFAQFNDLVIAVQVGTAPQKYTLSTDTGFVDLGGTPPQASHIAIINRFVVLTGLQSAARRVQWSDLDGPEVWTAGVGLSDFQDLPDGGTVHQVAGGEFVGVVFQDETVRSLTYGPGSATTFQITKIAENETLYAQYSVIQKEGRVFYLSASGFKMFTAGASSAAVPIGKERIDRTFFADVDAGNLQLIQAAADPTATRVYFAYKSKAGSAGQFDKVLAFDYAISGPGQWSLLPISGQYLAALARPGLTLEQLDAIAPTPLTVTGAANNGAGKVRLTVSALSNASFSLGTVGGGASQNTCTPYGILGTVEANVTTRYTIVDATHIDLPDVAFVNAYISGGQIGGSLDALPFSLDSVSTAAISALSAVSANGKVGFFTGANMEAIVQTGEKDLQGKMIYVDAVRPLTDSPDALVSMGTRLRAIDAIVFGDEHGIDDDGCCYVGLETRYATGRIRIPSGSNWSFVLNIQPIAEIAGEQ